MQQTLAEQAKAITEPAKLTQAAKQLARQWGARTKET